MFVVVCSFCHLLLSKHNLLFVVLPINELREQFNDNNNNSNNINTNNHNKEEQQTINGTKQKTNNNKDP